MRPVSPIPRMLSTATLAVVLGSVLAGCGDGGEEPAGPATSSTPTATPATEAGACAEAIPAEVVAALGWDSGTSAVEGLGGCEWAGDEGTIYVVPRPESFDAECDGIRDDAPEDTFRASIENPAGLPACGYFRDDDLGRSELIVEDGSAGVVSINVAATEPTSPESLREAALALTEHVSKVS